MPRFGKTARDLGAIGLMVALLAAVALLPPDNSLRDVQEVSSLRACVPPAYPPLVTGDPDRPGIDIEILRAVTDHIGVGLQLRTNDAMGRDFNPRNWGLNRAQCQIIAGGVVDSPRTRSFIETGPPYARTGWAVIAPEPLSGWEEANIGVVTLVSGLDRIGLASFLRSAGAQPHVVRRPEDLATGIAEGRFDAGITEALLAARLAADNAWTISWMPAALERYNLVFGLWKGDVTLKRAIDQAFADLAADGTLDAILARYAGAPLE
ncbi:substrate-binding periplasmic protein [Pelagibacterium xiamenense]|uniref:substrate-binding periplasmic protein n=1 Tax=Pelagibacterium xiamenense TaxID=2901140 RepID=UPI001E4F3ED1|nr:transporter substrate-binding domain-containing protein [Pelagibacterium xiamenense]MCD7061390.1 transporter substrate-binding domain-containing protein [Pelagibacterium xiamenense]